MNKMIFVVVVVAILAAIEAVYYFINYLSERKDEELKRRLRVVGEPAQGVQILRQRRLASSQVLTDILSIFPGLEKAERLIEQTDLELTVAQFLFYTLALSVGGMATGLIAVQSFAFAVIL